MSSGDDQPGPDAAEQVEMVFRPDVQDDLEAAGCTQASACHGGTTAPMPLAASPTTDTQWSDNYDQVAARADSAFSSLLVTKATGGGGHVASLTLDDPIIQRWQEWISAGTPYDLTAGGPGADAGPAGETDGGDAALTWENDIQPLLTARGCITCHGNQGAYSLESHSAALGFGSDGTPNVIAGNASSLLVAYCEQGHHEISYSDALIVLRWVIDWNARER
jgi:hypothetical protein